MADYKEYNFHLEQPESNRDIFIALLAQAGFEGFVETADGFLAYTNQALAPKSILQGVSISYHYEEKIVKEENWNKSWEAQIKPLIIADQIYIKTSFHPKKDYPFVITIDPKMSFGTGHHETTYLMIRHMLAMDFKNKSVIDMGSGTGVLSILSEQLGAHEIYAVDNDRWAYENMLENFENNQMHRIKAYYGAADTLKQLPAVDIFLANINRNILSRDIPAYVQNIKDGGDLVLSGFYTEDIPLIREVAEDCGMVFESEMVKNNWTGLRFIKSVQK